MKLFAYFVTYISAASDSDMDLDTTNTQDVALNAGASSGLSGTYEDTVTPRKCMEYEGQGATTAATVTAAGAGTLTECAIDEICQLEITRDTSQEGQVVSIKTGCVHKTVSTIYNIEISLILVYLGMC